MNLASGNVLRCISPIDGAVYAERAIATQEEALSLVESSRTVQKMWEARPLFERTRLVRAGVARLGEMNEEVAMGISYMMGRPIRYGGEFGGVNERASYMADIAEEALKPVVIEANERFERRLEREALGVVLIIAPWNYPYLTAINTLVPALIAGNAVVIKHSSQTMLAGEVMVRAFLEAGVPSGVFQHVFLDHVTTEYLIGKGCFDFVNFTGSVGGGRSIERAAAGTFTGTALELGGKDPGYVCEDANLDDAVATLIDGAMFNSGQCCCGIERIYVHESLYDDFVKKAVEIVSDYKLGSPLDKETTIGPMASKRFADEVRAQIGEAISDGAKPLVDPALFPKDSGNDAYLAPQILVNVNHDMRIMRDESFGPVVGIMKVSSDKEATDLMNDSNFGLTCSIWTKDPARAAKIGREIRTGTVFMNRADYLDPALCWSGCKDTGRGGSLSIIGFHNLTRVKSYHLKKDV